MNVEQSANSDEVVLVSLFFDHTGTTLYANEENLGEGSQSNLGRGTTQPSTNNRILEECPHETE